MKTRGEYRFSSLVKLKKKYAVFYFAGKRFFFYIDDVIVKQIQKNAPLFNTHPAPVLLHTLCLRLIWSELLDSDSPPARFAHHVGAHSMAQGKSESRSRRHQALHPSPPAGQHPPLHLHHSHLRFYPPCCPGSHHHHHFASHTPCAAAGKSRCTMARLMNSSPSVISVS